MALSLSCACGARFEVEDTYAGQTISCPDCQQPLPVPAQSREPARTSGYALASVLAALVFAFTGIGTILAILLGLIGLSHIRKNRGQVVGTGYAVFGIVAGALFTGLFALALVRGEFFAVGDKIREQILSAKVDRSGPLEVKRPGDGFAITRPTQAWGVARADLDDDLTHSGNLTLINVAKDTSVTVSSESIGFRSLEQCREDLLDSYRASRNDLNGPNAMTSGLKVRQSRRLPEVRGMEAVEVLFDVRVGGKPLTYLTRLVQKTGNDRKVYIIRGWAPARRFPDMEGEVRQALDSFRFLGPD